MHMSPKPSQSPVCPPRTRQCASAEAIMAIATSPCKTMLSISALARGRFGNDRKQKRCSWTALIYHRQF
eukprot:6152390-Alexandrium_andersonii.AAC.1